MIYLLVSAALITLVIIGWVLSRVGRSAAQLPDGRTGAITTKQAAPIRSVFVREQDVFASTEEGLFRALKADMRWRRLSLPETMPANGFFATQPASAHEILYFIPGVQEEQKRTGKQESDPKIFGLYCSRENGRSWQLLSKEYDFRHVFMHDNGSLYAIVETRFEMQSTPPPGGRPVDGKGSRRLGIRQRALMSHDMGRTWREISGTIAQGVQLFGIFADPDHSNLVCINAWGNRGYVLQAEDERFRWEMILDSAWRDTHETEEMFFGSAYSTQDTLYMQQANLTNYFQYPFDASVERPAFDITPTQPAYTFSLDGAKTIEASVQFLQPGPIVQFLDIEDGLACWGLRVMDPQGKRAVFGAPNTTDEASRLRQHALTARQPYTRTFDIAQFHPFQDKGTYKVQLTYDNRRIADRQKGKWSGIFSGQVFTVTIE